MKTKGLQKELENAERLGMGHHKYASCDEEKLKDYLKASHLADTAKSDDEIPGKSLKTYGKGRKTGREKLLKNAKNFKSNLEAKILNTYHSKIKKIISKSRQIR